MPDIRDRVEEDRGILKKIQMFIPGFRGYRRREDLRDADRMLRAQVAKKLGLQRAELETSRSLITQTYGSKEMDLIGGLISQYKRLEGKVAHAETGYSGFAADLQVKEDEINQLYDFDASMIDMIAAMSAGIESLKGALMAEDKAASQKELIQLRAKLNEFETQFSRRMNVIQGIEV